MVAEETYVLIQYIVLFATTIVFSILAVQKKTGGANAFASLLWCVFAIVNFIIGFTSIGGMLSFIFGLVAFIFMGGFIYSMYESIVEAKQDRYNFY